MIKMKFTKVREVKEPSYGTDGSAGIDFFVPEDFEEITLNPGEDVLVPSGIKANVPDGMVLIAFNKSGVATKKRLAVGAEVVDSDYQGEIHLHVYNTRVEKDLHIPGGLVPNQVSQSSVTIKPGDKLVQFVLLPYVHADLELCETLEEVFPEKTDRGEGGFGSTNRDSDMQEALEMTR